MTTEKTVTFRFPHADVPVFAAGVDVVDFDTAKQKSRVKNVRVDGEFLIFDTIYGEFKVSPVSDEFFKYLQKAEQDKETLTIVCK